MGNFEYDAIVVGSGPNGLAAAILLRQYGLSVLLLEAKGTVGGGMRSAELTLPGFVHDVCSAVHPMAAASPFFNSLPLEYHGLTYINPEVLAAHPFDDGTAGALRRDILETASSFGKDKESYLSLFGPLVEKWPTIAKDLLGPLGFPKYPLNFAQFGLRALLPATILARRFKTKQLKGLWAGMVAHSMLPFQKLTTSAIALVLTINGHITGWPIVKGGTQNMANALASYFLSLGGKIETNVYVRSLKDIPSSRAVVFDTSPRQLLQIAGHKFPYIYKRQMERYRYGMGLFKVDWALDGPIPFTAPECQEAGTVHIGNSFEEVALSESLIANGKHPEKPFVLLAQQSLIDVDRAPRGKHTAYAYCHVPNGSGKDMTATIEQQIERFAPGFHDLILAKHATSTAQLEEYNPNFHGGDVNGGALDIDQLFTRPALRFSPYRTAGKGLYICSASTPPGGGVHGMGGYHAAKQVLADIFKIQVV
ncbi:NAD(P)/FAD-dependent oxidoreductase [Olivibacter sp. SDN3]|uniref:phytoene desaturase family protein n=1 Tax=Olivibacter sp. SDN3 TaxID=2764720 RepID=UPI0016516B5F|nr:NAD(P)/FAD-dependent oxidoreductase [Olivibacter sp. SDN3]QNL49359.1 NAD(P)/FAD-dependent oxidoreductase [Olivibacter sp. SDN3]